MARKREPTHPGAILREDVLPALKIPVALAAREMKISRQQLYKILSEERAISPDMAVRLGKFCGNGPGIWLRMQASYDLWHAEQELGDIIEEIPTRQDAA